MIESIVRFPDRLLRLGGGCQAARCAWRARSSNAAGRRGRRCGAGRVRRGAGVGELGEPGAEQVVVRVGEEQRVLESGVGDLVAAAAGDALDEPVFAEAAQVLGHLADGDVLGVVPRRGAIRVRSSQLVKPRGSSRWMSRACRSACTRVSPKRSPGMRVRRRG